MNKQSRYLAISLLLALMLGGCSSSKKSGKNNIVKQTLEDIAARDNAYFNAKLQIEETAEKLWEDQVDVYDEVLPVFKYGDKNAAGGIGADMDDAIKRSKIAAQLHDDSKWVDDCYFMVGRAHFYKMEYEEALQAFQYVIYEYSDLNKKKKHSSKKRKKSSKKRKKSKSKSKSEEEIASQDKSFAFLRHHLRSPESSIWVVKTLIEQGLYTDAQTGLSVIRADETFPTALLGQLDAVEAHLYMKQGDQTAAISPLKSAIDNTKDKKLKARYHFILAQLNNLNGQNGAAISNYEEVLHLKPNYEMEFFARINMAKIYQEQGMKSSAEIKRMLKDLLKDEKNIDYYGLIYYSLAELELAGGNEKEGIEYLHEAVNNAGSDTERKALAYLRLGDIAYDVEGYQEAYYDYDSCLMTLPETMERHSEVESRRDGLKDLVEYLELIKTEEKLQYWAGLPEKDLELEIDELLKELEQEAEQAQDLESYNRQKEANLGDGSSSSDWYFYRADIRGRGLIEFERKWGKRANEDNWRRSDKRTFEPEEEEVTQDGEQDLNTTVDLESDRITRDQIMSAIPDTDEKMEASNDKIMGALYLMGSIYKDYLKNTPKTIETWDRLMTDFPDNPHKLQVSYQLFLLYDSNQKKDYYKNIILTEFPESVFAQMILDPDYLDRLKDEDREVEEYYTATFAMYENARFEDVLGRIQLADSNYRDNPLQPKYDMLKAMTLGQLQKTEEFTEALQEVVNKYPDTDVAARARQILNYIRRGSAIKKARETQEDSPFKIQPDQEHFLTIFVFQTGREVSQMKNKLADYNRDKHSLEGLRVSSLLFESDKTIILVKTFENSTKAMTYYDQFVLDAGDLFDNMTPDNYKIAVIARSNYTALYRSKDLDGYMGFFKDIYLTDE